MCAQIDEEVAGGGQGEGVGAAERPRRVARTGALTRPGYRLFTLGKGPTTSVVGAVGSYSGSDQIRAQAACR